MMAEFEKLQIINGTSEQILLAPNLDDHENAAGGTVTCRDRAGNAVAVLSGGGNDGRGSLLRLTNSQGKTRVRILDGDEAEAEDGGILILDASADAQQPGPAGATSSIVLNATKRSLVIHSKQGGAMVELGPNGDLILGGGGKAGDIILRDVDGNERVRLRQQRLQILNEQAEIVAELGPKGDLVLGGGGMGGDIILRDVDGNERVRLSAQRLQILTGEGEIIAELGSKGDLVLGGGGMGGGIILRDGQGKELVILEATEKELVIRDDSKDLVRIGRKQGDVDINGNLSQQSTTIRSRKVKDNQQLDIVSLGQDGAYLVELAASASKENGYIASHYSSWMVFTYQNAPFFNEPLSSAGAGNFTGLDFSEHAGKVRVTIGKTVAEGPVLEKLNDATLSVRSFYGPLERF